MFGAIALRTLAGITEVGNKLRLGEHEGDAGWVAGALSFFVCQGVGLGLLIVGALAYGLRRRSPPEDKPSGKSTSHKR